MRYWKKYKGLQKLESQPDVCVGIVVATYQQTHSLETLLRSFQAQTHRNFKVVVAHDGPWDPQHVLDLRFKFGSDDRFTFTHSPERKNQFGHNLREMVRVGLASATDAVGFCNGDSYYAPTYMEWMTAQLARDGAVLAYCNCLHSHKMWQPMKTGLARGKIDVGCFLAASDLVGETAWTSTEFAADWVYIEQLARKAGKKGVTKVDGYLYCHN